jgi:hypothetical protein
LYRNRRYNYTINGDYVSGWEYADDSSKLTVDFQWE